MTKEEKDAMRLSLAKSVVKAHEAYIQSRNTAEKFGLNCQNLQNIWYADGRNRGHKVLVNGKEPGAI